MNSTGQREILIEPVIHFPGEAQVGQSYLMTIDIHMVTSPDEWPYEEEEYPVSFLLNTMPLFSHEPIGDGDPSVIIHRFGGTYGPATFLLTAAQEEMAGNIGVLLVNKWGIPIEQVSIESRVRREIAPEDTPITVQLRRERNSPLTTTPIEMQQRGYASLHDVKEQRFANYQLIKMLGEDSFAQVFQAKEQATGKEVALKVFNGPFPDQNSLDELRKEVEATKSLDHSHIVHIHQFAVEGGVPYLVMDYVPFSWRDQHPQGVPLPLDMVVKYTKQLGSALQYAHDHRIVHRDLKPTNLLLNHQGDLLLGDFGIAIMLTENGHDFTQHVAGTLQYMAPEAFEGAIERASDQYSLGIIVYEWLTGKCPFEGTFTELWHKHAYEAPEPLRKIIPTLPEAVEQVVLRALEKKPDQRFQDVESFVTRLEEAAILKASPESPSQSVISGADRLTYDQAILFAETRLKVADDDLRGGQVETVTRAGSSIPWGNQGGFAVVYKFRTKSSKVRALRCFNRPMEPSIKQRYELMKPYFRQHVPDITADFTYYDQGIEVAKVANGQVQNAIHPVIDMEWVEGVTLFEHVEKLAKERDQAKLGELANKWLEVVEKLHQAHMAHGCLCANDVMVRQDGRLVLIDYDGVYIPAFAGMNQLIYGTRGFEHPQMTRRPFDEWMDEFSSLVIFTALLALQAHPTLWQTYVKSGPTGRALDQTLLFTHEDFEDPQQSALFLDLENSPSAQVREVVRELKAACGQKVADVRFPTALAVPDYLVPSLIKPVQPATPKPAPVSPGQASSQKESVSSARPSDNRAQRGLYGGGKITCPYCFESFHPGDCAIVSSINGSADGSYKILKPAPQGFWQQRLARLRVPPLTGPGYAFELAQRQCPLCKRLLPPNIELADNYIIALVGNQAAGKTHFIASSIQELINPVVMQAMGVSQVRPLSQEVELKYRREYYDAIHVEKRALPPNPPGRPYEPLIYVLNFSKESQRARPVNLIFYDVAGEEFSDPVTLIDYAKFIFHANAMIVLTDPLTIEGIANHIHPKYRRSPQDLALSRGDVLTWIVPHYQQYLGTKVISIPTAITLSKSDLLEFLPRSSAFFTQPSYRNPSRRKILRSEFDRIDADVEEVLHKYGGMTQIQWKSQFSNARFFAVSATGWPEDPATGVYPAIEPIRILDPLLWILSELGVITIQ